jgi:hypothetical protein
MACRSTVAIRSIAARWYRLSLCHAAPPPTFPLCRCLPGKGRPEPPKALDQIEARAWNDVVDALPGQWIDASAQIVLRRVVAQVAIAERVEACLRDLAMREDDPEALEAEQVLASMHRETAKSVIHGLTALRATPRSRMAPREGRSKFERGAGAFRPWEIVAKRSDGQTS